MLGSQLAPGDIISDAPNESSFVILASSGNGKSISINYTINNLQTIADDLGETLLETNHLVYRH